MSPEQLAEIEALRETRRRCFGTSEAEDAARAPVGKVGDLVASLREERARGEAVDKAWRAYVAAVEDVYLRAICGIGAGGADEREMARLRAVRAQRAADLRKLGVEP